jgi:hypothetical protein
LGEGKQKAKGIDYQCSKKKHCFYEGFVKFLKELGSNALRTILETPNKKHPPKGVPLIFLAQYKQPP